MKEQHYENSKGDWRDLKNRGQDAETVEPANLSVSWGRDTASFYEILIYPDYAAGEHGGPRLVSKHQVAYGDQLDESQFAQGLYHAHNIAIQNPTRRVLYVRQDDKRHVPEHPGNGPYKQINGEWRKE